jgi:phage tail sheath gpL-like
MTKTYIPDLVSTQWLLPGIFNKFDASGAIRGLRGMPRSLALFGQITNPLFNPTNFNQPITVTIEAEAIGLFGEGSMLLAMWRGAKANATLGLKITCIALADEPTANTAQWLLAFSADATHLAGEQPVYIEGQRLAVGVNELDTATTIRDKMLAKLLANPKLPLTAAPSGTDAITLTAKNKGERANDIDIRATYFYDDTPIQGVNMVISQSASGALNPDLSAAIVNLRNTRDTHWVVPYLDSANVVLIEAEATRRWSHEVQTDFQFSTAIRGTEGKINAWLLPRNNLCGHTLCTTKDLTSPWAAAAMAGAAIESQCMKDPAAPFTGIALTGYIPALRTEHFEDEQINNLMLAGGSSVDVLEDGTATMLPVVTNYTTHKTGAYDESYRYMNWVKTLSYFRWYRNTEFAIQTEGFKMGEYADDIPGQKIMTNSKGADIALHCYENFVDAGLMQNMAHYTKTLLTQITGTKFKIVDEPVIMLQHNQTEITSKWVAGHV